MCVSSGLGRAGTGAVHGVPCIDNLVVHLNDPADDGDYHDDSSDDNSDEHEHHYAANDNSHDNSDDNSDHDHHDGPACDDNSCDDDGSASHDNDNACRNYNVRSARLLGGEHAVQLDDADSA